MNRYILFLFAFIVTSCFSQNESFTSAFQFPKRDTNFLQIQLNDKLDTLSCGKWVTGDYAFYVNLPVYINFLENDYAGLQRATMELASTDTANLVRYHGYSKRYYTAINELKAAQSGFDLRKLVLYIAPESEERNKGNSPDVELYVRQLIERGEAVVYYKGKRILILNKRILSDYIMSNIILYFDDEKNCAFSYIGHLNW